MSTTKVTTRLQIAPRTPKPNGAGNPNWRKGISGNPGGRPVGSRNKFSIIFDADAVKNVRDISEVVFKLAREGNPTCLEIITKRLWPVRRGAPIQIVLPTVNTIDDLPKVFAAISSYMQEGEISPDEAESVSKFYENWRNAIAETFTPMIKGLTDRIIELEHQQHSGFLEPPTVTVSNGHDPTKS